MQGLGDGTLPIVAKLLAVESAGPDFIGVNDGGCHTCYIRNPDGPEAVELITAYDEALEAMCVQFGRLKAGDKHQQEAFDRAVDLMAKARSESGQ